MSKLRRTCAVVIVTAVLAIPAFAGIMDSPGTPAPAPAPGQTSTSTSTSNSMTTVILTILSLIR